MKIFGQDIRFRDIWTTYRFEVLFFVLLLACVIMGHWASRFVPEDFFENYVILLQHGANITVCVLGAWLLFRHSEGLRIRKAYGYILVAWGVADSIFLVQTFVLNQPVLYLGPDGLSAYEMLAGNFLAWLLLVYPTEELRPGWMNLKHALMQLLPMVVLVVVDYYVPLDLRYVIVLYPLFLVIILLTHIHAYRVWCEDNYSSMDRIDVQWIVRYLMMLVVFGLSYVYILLSDNPVRTLTQNSLLFFLFCYSIDQVLFRQDSGMVSLLEGEEAASDDKNEASNESSENAEYRAKLEQWMAGEKPYLNPNFRLMDLRSVLPLNRTYLSQFIHSEYDCSFYQFVNRYRVEEAQRLMREQPSLKMNEIASLAGFSSPTYFIRIFTDSTGCTPREWSKKVLFK